MADGRHFLARGRAKLNSFRENRPGFCHGYGEDKQLAVNDGGPFGAPGVVIAYPCAWEVTLVG